MDAYYKHFSHNNAYGSCATPSTGTAKLLVIPIWFADSSNYIAEANKETIRNDIQTAYFGTNEETGWRSVKTFYEEESLGAITLEGTVSDWYVESRSASSFGSENTGMNNTYALVSTVSDWYFQNNPTEKRTDYDRDKDGYLDGVMLIYAYPDYSQLNYNSSYGNLWAYCYWYTEDSANVTKPMPNQYFWASYDFMFSSSAAQEHTGKSTKASGDTRYCTIDAHTYIHEMGHMFGLDDYYDYSGSYSPAGAFSMQDHNVGSHDAFSILSLGWGKAYIPTETTTIELKPLTKSGEMILLTPSWNQYNSAFDEYLLLEYYTPDGVNAFDCAHTYSGSVKGSSSSGIRLWHVDARLVYYNSQNVSASNITTNPNYSCRYGVQLAMSNTYNKNGVNQGYLSPLGSSYYNYNLLQLIHNNKSMTSSATNTNFSSSSLFGANSSFSMSQYGKQFYNNGKLNSKTDLGFTFEVNSLNSEYASITVTKI